MPPITLVNAWPSWIDARRQYILVIITGKLPWPRYYISIFTPVGKTMRCVEECLTSFRMGTKSCITMQGQQGLGRSNYAHWLSVRKYGVFCLSRLVCLRVGDIGLLWPSIVSWFMGRFWFCFYLFQKWFPFQKAREFVSLLLFFLLFLFLSVLCVRFFIINKINNK